MEDKSVEKSATMPGLNGGTLRRGGNKTPGIGRPSSTVREKCRGSFEKRIRVLEKIADDPKSNDSDRIRAVDTLGKYGGLQQFDVVSDGEGLRTLDSIMSAALSKVYPDE